jgi:hypothetical protein
MATLTLGRRMSTRRAKVRIVRINSHPLRVVFLLTTTRRVVQLLYDVFERYLSWLKTAEMNARLSGCRSCVHEGKNFRQPFEIELKYSARIPQIKNNDEEFFFDLIGRLSAIAGNRI